MFEVYVAFPKFSVEIAILDSLLNAMCNCGSLSCSLGHIEQASTLRGPHLGRL